MNALRASFAPYWESIQRTLFPRLEQALGPLTEKQQQLVQTLEVIRIERLIRRYFRAPGRPPKDRAAMARAFVAKAVYDLPSTRALLDRLAADVALRRLCGWERKFEVPSESVFSRAFAEFADTQLPQRVHEALIRETHHVRLVGHLSRDSTAIEAREKPATKEKPPTPPKRKRGRPKKGEERPKVLTRLERQPTMNLPAMLDDADRLRCRHEEEQQGLQDHLGRLQAAHRRGRRPDSDQLVRRAKAPFLSGCESRPATVAPGR